MSESPDAPDASVLGKRVRNEAGQNVNDLQVNNINSTVQDDSDDDDVGPMPMPAQAPAAKKKRRGLLSFSILKIYLFTNNWMQVLPHERLYLEHLPNTDQYYKSFMHRDTINFSVVTR